MATAEEVRRETEAIKRRAAEVLNRPPANPEPEPEPQPPRPPDYTGYNGNRREQRRRAQRRWDALYGDRRSGERLPRAPG